MKFLIHAVVNFCTSFISSLMGPISGIVLNFLPGLTGFSEMVSNFFTWLTNFVVWALSWLPFTASFWVIFVLYWTYRLSVPLLTHAIKTAVRWWHAIIP